MNMRKRLAIFVGFFILAFLYWRSDVFLFYRSGEISLLREATGLTIHHTHYGLIFVLIASLLLIFHKTNFFSIGLMGFGLGSAFDSFVSGLLKFNSVRATEIQVYSQSSFLTAFVFINIILLAGIFYQAGKNSKARKRQEQNSSHAR